MGASFSEKLLAAINAFFEGVVRFLPGLLAAFLILVIGIVIGWIVKVAVRRTLAVTRFDHFCDSSGVSQVLSKADIRTTPSRLVGSLFFWLVFASFLMAGLSALEVEVTKRLISEFFLYLPRILAALAILLAGFLLANFVSRAALLASVNANMPSPRLISGVVRFLIAILAFAMALEQLEIAKSIVMAAFIISFGAVMLGLALAFGLGGRDVAKKVLERQLRDLDQPPDKDGFSHI
jgi:Mechanosensitive ion channel, conserved TM helix